MSNKYMKFTQNGDWALTFAVAEGRVAVAECLLNNGGEANINARNNVRRSKSVIRQI